MKAMLLATLNPLTNAVAVQKGQKPFHFGSMVTIMISPWIKISASQGSTTTKQSVFKTAIEGFRVVIPIHMPNHATAKRFATYVRMPVIMPTILM